MQLQYKPGTRREPDSLAPLQLERTSVEEDAAQLRRGNGTPLMLSLVLATVASFGGLEWLGNIDRQQAYAHAAERLETIDSQQSEAFLRCALPNVQRTQLSSTQALHNAIEVVSERFDKYYGRQLAHCAHYLDDLNTELAAVSVPRDMKLQLDSLQHAARLFRRAWDNYRIYLQDPEQRYDFVKATPMIEKVTLAWADYRAQQDQIKGSLRAHE